MCFQSCGLCNMQTMFHQISSGVLGYIWKAYWSWHQARFEFVFVGLSCINHHPHVQVMRACCSSCPFALTSCLPSSFIRSDLITDPSEEGHKETLKQCFWLKYADALKTCIYVKACSMFQSECAFRGEHILSVIKEKSCFIYFTTEWWETWLKIYYWVIEHKSTSCSCSYTFHLSLIYPSSVPTNRPKHFVVRRRANLQRKSWEWLMGHIRDE